MPLHPMHIKTAKMLGYRVNHVRARYQLRDPQGIPLGHIYRSPLAAWSACPRFYEDVPLLLKWARRNMGRAMQHYDPVKKMYTFEVGDKKITAPADNAGPTFARFIVGIMEKADDNERAASERTKRTNKAPAR